MGQILGKIRTVYENSKVITILNDNRIKYFYLSKSLSKKFEPYLQEGIFVDLTYKDTTKIVDDVEAYPVVCFNKVYKLVGLKEEIYYDTSAIKEGVKKLLKKDNYRLFIDLEFTMPPYDYHHGTGKEFKAEIVEYGMYLEDSAGNMIDSASGLVRPLESLWINERTCEFIGVSKEAIMNAPYYSKFYNTLKDFMMMYQPIIYIWGKNDYLMIEHSYAMHKLDPITSRSNFVNLMQIIKNYFNSRDDIGLYNAFSLLGSTPPMELQDHNALHDAEATLEVFHLFEQELEKK